MYQVNSRSIVTTEMHACKNSKPQGLEEILKH